MFFNTKYTHIESNGKSLKKAKVILGEQTERKIFTFEIRAKKRFSHKKGHTFTTRKM